MELVGERFVDFDGTRMYMEKKCDLVFEVEGKEIPCHREVVEPAMGYVQTALASTFQEAGTGRIVFRKEDFPWTHAALHALVRWLYGRISTPLHSSAFDVHEILGLADYLQMDAHALTLPWIRHSMTEVRASCQTGSGTGVHRVFHLFDNDLMPHPWLVSARLDLAKACAEMGTGPCTGRLACGLGSPPRAFGPWHESLSAFLSVQYDGACAETRKAILIILRRIECIATHGIRAPTCPVWGPTSVQRTILESAPARDSLLDEVQVGPGRIHLPVQLARGVQLWMAEGAALGLTPLEFFLDVCGRKEEPVLVTPTAQPVLHPRAKLATTFSPPRMSLKTARAIRDIDDDLMAASGPARLPKVDPNRPVQEALETLRTALPGISWESIGNSSSEEEDSSSEEEDSSEEDSSSEEERRKRKRHHHRSKNHGNKRRKH
jgi:hypothetical protein